MRCWFFLFVMDVRCVIEILIVGGILYRLLGFDMMNNVWKKLLSYGCML